MTSREDTLPFKIIKLLGGDYLAHEFFFFGGGEDDFIFHVHV